ncbi:sushi, von Willebrand factor type A, EGF and pentraxin domain-containing protein 1 isoform X3, partial [Silurus asotus]
LPNHCGPPPRVENGLINGPYKDDYQEQERVQYVCAERYELIGENEIQCTKGAWTSEPFCDPKDDADFDPAPCVIEESGEYLMEGERKKLNCGSPKKKFVTCVNGGLEYGECRIIWKIRGRSSTEKMKMIILALSICTWQVVLGQKTCEYPAVPNGHPVGKLKQFYNSGETLSLICDSTHKFDGTRYALCDDGSWILPACKPLDGKCAAPSVLNAKPQGEISAPYPAGSTVRFLCDHGFEFEGTQYALCDDGTWRLPACKPIRCESRPRIEHGDVTELSDAHELQVQCVIFHKLVGPET